MQEQQEVIFKVPGPQPPGTRPLEAIPRLRDRRAGRVPGLAWDGGGWLQVELNHASYQMLNMLSQIGATAEFYTDRLRQRI